MLGIGGSGKTKRVSAEKYLEFIKLCVNSFKCNFFLATGKKIEEQEILKKIEGSVLWLIKDSNEGANNLKKEAKKRQEKKLVTLYKKVKKNGGSN